MEGGWCWRERHCQIGTINNASPMLCGCRMNRFGAAHGRRRKARFRNQSVSVCQSRVKPLHVINFCSRSRNTSGAAHGLRLLRSRILTLPPPNPAQAMTMTPTPRAPKTRCKPLSRMTAQCRFVGLESFSLVAVSMKKTCVVRRRSRELSSSRHIFGVSRHIFGVSRLF